MIRRGIFQCSNRCHATLFFAPLLVAVLLCYGCAPATSISQAERQAALAKLEQSFDPGVLTAFDGRLPSASLADTLAPSAAPDPLVERMNNLLTHQLAQRGLDTTLHAAWQIMHGVVCYGSELMINTPDRGRVGALDYAFNDGLINGFELSLGDTPLPGTGRTGIRARVEPGSYIGQGHPDQWLAMCAMSSVPIDTEVLVGGQRRTLLDWCRQAQWDVSRNHLEEFSWTLIALTHYLPNEPSWMTADGVRVDWELLVETELSYDLDDSPCGGTHRLSGLVRALNAKQRLGLPDSQVWSRARRVVDDCIVNCRVNRGSDGSLSSYYFVRPTKSADLAAELASSGHLFEFLALALPAEELEQTWVKVAGLRVCEILERTRDIEMECGALFHALNGLRLYRDRFASVGR
jgi:hypothetical protein